MLLRGNRRDAAGLSENGALSAADLDTTLALGPGTQPTTVKAYLNKTYGWKHEFIGWVAFILIGTIQPTDMTIEHTDVSLVGKFI